MTDIDFDELDKAVNSLMDQGQTPQQAAAAQPAPASEAVSATALPPQPAPTPPAANALPPIAPPVAPVAAVEPAAPTPGIAEPEIATAATDVTEPIAPAAASIVTKRRGQFMDVMHPSSDMTTATKQSTPVRTGANLAPLTPNALPTEQSPALNPASSSEDTTTMPDPLDMQPASAATEQEPPTEASSSEGGALSPFLPDAKVEKTPLGSAAPTTTQTEAVDTPPKVEEESSSVDSEIDPSSTEGSDSKDELMQDGESTEVPQVPAKPLPAEFASDVLSVESDTKQPVAAASVAAEPPSSIVQQYKEKKTDADAEEHAPIYDSTTQPLDHPPKKKSGWMGIVFILLLVILGAGGAAAVYFFKLL